MREYSLISVIVPIYKVQDYLDECIESIISQTYSNIEVILVDDGSPDRCPQMCDEWAKRDSRIRVVHKKNGGLSSARNAGLDVAKGEYISFVDSDDFICKDALQNLYDRVNNDKSIGITSGLIYRYQDGCTSIFNNKWFRKTEKIIPASDFLLETMGLKTSFTVWNKLYRRDIIGETRFRVGRNNEDTLFMYDLGKNMVYKNALMVEIPLYVYYYRYREDSICTTTKVPLVIDTLSNYEFMMADCKQNNPQLHRVLLGVYVQMLYGFVDSLLLNPVWFKMYFSQCQEKLKNVPFEYIKNEFGFKDVIYIQMLKYIPLLRMFIRKIKA